MMMRSGSRRFLPTLVPLWTVGRSAIGCAAIGGSRRRNRRSDPPPGPARAGARPACARARAPSWRAARFGRDGAVINGGLHWRVYADKPDPTGVFRLLKEDRSAQPVFVLPAGGYIVHVAFGLASAAKPIQLRNEAMREVFEIAAGGLRIEGRVGNVQDSRPARSRSTSSRAASSSPASGSRSPRACSPARSCWCPRAPTTSCRNTATATPWCAPTFACRPASSPTSR